MENCLDPAPLLAAAAKQPCRGSIQLNIKRRFYRFGSNKYLLQGSRFVCRRKSPPTGGHFRRQTKHDPCSGNNSAEMSFDIQLNCVPAPSSGRLSSAGQKTYPPTGRQKGMLGLIIVVGITWVAHGYMFIHDKIYANGCVR